MDRSKQAEQLLGDLGLPVNEGTLAHARTAVMRDGRILSAADPQSWADAKFNMLMMRKADPEEGTVAAFDSTDTLPPTLQDVSHIESVTNPLDRWSGGLLSGVIDTASSGQYLVLKDGRRLPLDGVDPNVIKGLLLQQKGRDPNQPTQLNARYGDGSATGLGTQFMDWYGDGPGLGTRFMDWWRS
jgi:hypothetical protein